MTTVSITETTITASLTGTTISVSVTSTPVSVTVSNVPSTIFSVAYGNMNMFIDHTDPPLVVDILSLQTWAEVPSGFSGGYTYLTTFQNGHEIEVDVAGKYSIDWHIAMVGGAGNEIMGTAGKNNTADETMACHGTVASAGKFIGVSGSGIMDCEVGDVISLFVLNESGTTDISIEHAGLTVMYIGY